MTQKETSLRERMIDNAKAYNKALTFDYLDKKETEIILNFTHPSDRSDFVIELNKIRKEEENDNI